MSALVEVAEKRLSPRVGIRGHMRYRRVPIDARGPRNAIVLDVGRGGFRFRSDEMLERKSNLLLELHLPGPHIIRSLARVAWVKAVPEEDLYDIGGMFVEPPLEALTALGKIVIQH